MPAAPCTLTRSWISDSCSDVLFRILDSEILLTIWERLPLVDLQPALGALLRSTESMRLDVPSQEIGQLARRLEFFLKNTPPTVRSSVHGLAEDMQKLTNLFAEISGRDHLRLRFERVEDDGCALFHVDTLPMRMLCTYTGPGTQWLEEDNVRRDQLGSRGRGIQQANAAIVMNPEKIHTVPSWHVLVFKGRLWEGHGFSDGLVHRSAPVRHSTDYRLRLTIDFSNSCGC